MHAHDRMKRDEHDERARAVCSAFIPLSSDANWGHKNKNICIYTHSSRAKTNNRAFILFLQQTTKKINNESGQPDHFFFFLLAFCCSFFLACSSLRNSRRFSASSRISSLKGHEFGTLSAFRVFRLFDPAERKR